MNKRKIEVDIPAEIGSALSKEQLKLLREILEQDPRPAYKEDSEHVYGMTWAGMDVRFTVSQGLLTVREIVNQRE